MGIIQKVREYKKQGYSLQYIKDNLLSVRECTEYEMYKADQRVQKQKAKEYKASEDPAYSDIPSDIWDIEDSVEMAQLWYDTMGY